MRSFNHFLEDDLKNTDKLKIDGKFFNSRLILGTALFPNVDVLNKSIEKAESEIITTSVRRLGLNQKDFFVDQINKFLDDDETPFYLIYDCYKAIYKINSLNIWFKKLRN